jgi:L-arabinokinase
VDELTSWGELVAELDRHEPALRGFFAAAGEVVLARAPGRLDVLGGIADYSGALVLELPLYEAARVVAARTNDDRVWVASRGATLRQVRLPARELWSACSSVVGARDYFAARPPAERWVAYALGGLALLAAEHGQLLEGGLRVLVDSSVPEGKGVSSSAAIEVASLSAVFELWREPLTAPQLGLAGQRVENLIVGAPCGVMDQLTSACGEQDRLLAILCQPAELRGSVALPPGLGVFGIDSGLRHAVRGSGYRRVRVAAFMGLRILAERLGARVVPLEPGRVLLEDDPLRGYLANLEPSRLTTELMGALPESLSGADFLARYAGISDGVTSVDPAEHYMVRAAALHPIFEHRRVQEFAESLASANSDTEYAELGELLYASHSSYSACGLGSPGTDHLVELVRRAGPGSGIWGAKITGGGSGGTVALLARRDARARVQALADRYASESGHTAQVFARSAPGAWATPPRRQKLAHG